MARDPEASQNWKAPRGVFALAAGAVAVMLAGPSEGACSKPTAPACAIQDGGFSDVNDFDRCRMQMLAYRDGVDTYISCSQQGGLKSQDEEVVRNAYDDARQQFNRRGRATTE